MNIMHSIQHCGYYEHTLASTLVHRIIYVCIIKQLNTIRRINSVVRKLKELKNMPSRLAWSQTKTGKEHVMFFS